ncbi:MAG: PorP/SprF family type IX secretion system membrane protein [Saprospiraceae bacterium]|nr:PorP/SprF family type IX secretion system membrane protein [Saprospiraceae bacterium]MDZ4703140.1 PorP/SprF family type IX secretion system membrane protein [Saprospiraceae bacterium]
MTRILLLLLLSLAPIAVFAQQLSLFTQYRENATLINPAAIEGDYFAYGQNMTFGVSYRAQWVGLANGPRTQTLRGSYLNTDYSGVTLMAGGHLINDQTGPTGFTGVYGRIGGVVSGDPEYSGLSIALSAGLVQYRVDASKIRLRDPNDVIGEQDQSQLFPDVGLGVYYYQMVGDGDFFYTGVSVPQVIGLDLTFQDENGEFYTKRVQHFYGLLGFYKFFDNDSFLEPSVWVKYAPNAPINADINLRYQMPSSFWIGTGVSTGGNFHMDAGVIIGQNTFDNTIRIGYGFDYSFSSFGPTAGSTHEINLTFSFEK